MRDKEFQAVQKVFTDGWAYFKEFIQSDMTLDATWESIVDRMQELYKSNEESEFAKRIGLAVFNELERIALQEQNGTSK